MEISKKIFFFKVTTHFIEILTLLCWSGTQNSNYPLRWDLVIIPGAPTEFIPSLAFLALFQTKMG